MAHTTTPTYGLERHSEFIFDGSIDAVPRGILKGGLDVSYFSQIPSWDSADSQELSQGVVVHSPTHGKSWSYADFPPRVVRVVEVGEGSKKRVVPESDALPIIGARHNTIAVALNGEDGASVIRLDSSGHLVGSVSIPYRVFAVFVDADERIWVQVLADEISSSGAYYVYDTALTPLGRVAERSVQDASGDYLLTLGMDSQGVARLCLLRKASGSIG